MKLFKRILLLFISFVVLGALLLFAGLYALVYFDQDEVVSPPKSEQTVENKEEVEETVEETEEFANNIKTIDSKAAIEADVYLSGSGTGFHGKLVVQTPTSAVSFGPQYDEAGPDEYRERTAFIIENVESNDQGGQTYTRVGFAENNTWYHLLLAVKEDGKVEAYVDGELVGEVQNNGIANKNITLSVEGSGRKNGDTVDVTFSNIRLKGEGKYNEKTVYKPNIKETNPGITVTEDGTEIKITGTIEGLKDTEDWDSAYDSVSGVAQFPIR